MSPEVTGEVVPRSILAQTPSMPSISNRTALRNLVSEVTGEVIPSSILALAHSMPPDTLDAAEPTIDVRLDVDEPTFHVQMVGGATPTADMSSDGLALLLA